MSKHKFSQEDIEFVYNLLRQGSTKWQGRAECLRLARKKVFEKRAKSSGNAVYKYHWQCAKCRKWFRDEACMEVDHKVEIGGVTSFNGDWNEMVAKVLPRPVQDHLQALCVWCHARKTKNYMAASSQWERKKR